jgi:hypothetical protein
VIRNIERQLQVHPQWPDNISTLLRKTKHIHAQEPQDSDKLYNVHAHETKSIGKGRTHMKLDKGLARNFLKACQGDVTNAEFVRLQVTSCKNPHAPSAFLASDFDRGSALVSISQSQPCLDLI